jgi:FKBP-type peptidyl-prolyl cis-trans isomerase FkpA
MKHFLSALLVLTIFISCSKEKKEAAETETDYVTKNEQEIKDYISKNKLTAQKSDTGLYYVVSNSGTGAQPTATSNVTVAYKGYFTNGTVFDESDSAGISFGLDQVIKGWTEGIAHFKNGGSGILLVPAHLGYGNNDYSSIPGGSVLIFDVKLISVN